MGEGGREEGERRRGREEKGKGGRFVDVDHSKAWKKDEWPRVRCVALIPFTSSGTDEGIYRQSRSKLFWDWQSFYSQRKRWATDVDEANVHCCPKQQGCISYCCW